VWRSLGRATCQSGGMSSATRNTDGSSGTAGGTRTSLKDWRALAIGAAVSIAIFVGVLVLQARHSWLLKLPTQWLALAALPVLVGMALGGYVGRFSFAGVEVEAPSLKPVEYVKPGPEGSKDAASIHADWTIAREQEYARTHRLELVHIYKPSARRGQKYDVSIYLMRHHSGEEANQTTGFTEIEKAEFFFGVSWGNRIFTAVNDGGVVGVNTSAWGTFLATCRVIFNDGSAPVVLHRYVDFEMAPLRS
jgi:hypothetical protein